MTDPVRPAPAGPARRRFRLTPSTWPAVLLVTFLAAEAPAQQVQGPAATEHPGLVFPGSTWETATPESQGLDGNVLRAELAAISAARTGPLMVVANGRVVHTAGDITAPERLFSCSKAVTFMVAAKLIHDGRIAGLDTLVPNTVPGAWSSYPGDATFRMFMTMTSDYGLPAPRSPGLRHAYNNHAVDFCGEYLSRTFFGIGPDRMHDVVQSALLRDIGRQDAVTFNGQWGGWFGGLSMSCRDLARLGLLLQRDGEWDGQRLLASEFTRGLFRLQIPANSIRYRSSISNESSMWNQQAATDLLDDRWSFGLWRAGEIRTAGSWEAAAMEGYRGKRVLLCPRGTLPNPDLELMLVCLPHLSNEGPATDVYRDALVRAVIVPDRHPDHDPRCLTATFDDATTGRMVVRSGAPTVTNGRLRATQTSRLVLPEAFVTDGTIILSIPGGLPAGARAGAMVRAANAVDDAFALHGTQSWIAVEHASNGALRVAVVHPSSGSIVWHRGPDLSRVRPTDDLIVRIDVDADRVRTSVNGEVALGTNGYAGIPDPQEGGLYGIRTGGHTTPIEFDYVIARPTDGPVGQVATDARGEHTLALLAPDHLGNLHAGTFHVDYDDLRMDLSVLPLVIPWVWPTLVATSHDHMILSSHTALIVLEAGKPLVFQVGNRREGELLR